MFGINAVRAVVSGWNLEWAAQRNYGCPSSGIVQGWVSWGEEELGLGEVIPASGRKFGMR